MGSFPFSLLWFTSVFQLFSCIQTLHVSGNCLNDQRSHLVQFRDALQLDSTHSKKLVLWNQSRNCCNWGGVGCDNFGHVISLELDNESISVRNEDWKSIFSLQHLEKLNLAWNNFHSVKFPIELYNLTSLKYLNFSESYFTGQIPIGLSRMTSLVTLDLSIYFPDEPLQLKNPGGLKALFQNLTQLRELHLDGVNISAQGSAWCNAFSSLSKLQILSLRNCYLSGPINSSLLKLRSLTNIALDNNKLSTIVPEFFANFTNLMALSLGSCDLYGQVPEKIFQATTLESLVLSNNFLLGGSLPQFPENGSFREIVHSYKNFSSSLPDSIGNLGAFSKIDLRNCNFSGPLPTTIANLPELVYLDLSRNAFAGPISSDHFKGLTNLEFIDLSYNSLSGSFPSSLFALPSLQNLKLSSNRFSGQIGEFPNASSSLLRVLDLSSNHLSGFIPKFIFDLQRLNVLSVSFNFFTGTIRLDMFNALQNLHELELSYNNLSIDASCSTSTCLSTFPQLRILKLASCNLKMFPDLKNQTEMFQLDLSLNNITGEIPNWIWKDGLRDLNLSSNLLEDLQKPYTFPPLLFALDLHANQLKGEIPIPPQGLGVMYLDYSSNNFSISIPPNIGDYITRTTRFLSLSNNNIPGNIPESICNASYLQVLDLSNNALIGRIPTCLFAMVETLGIFNLRGNKLHGLIPDTFQNNSQLRTLDLSWNALEGKIPTSLANCKLLQVLNVGNNNLQDKFPCALAKGPNLRILILRSNRFQGEINCSWDKYSWPSLQIMDIAYNNFSGALPPGLFLNWGGMRIDDDSKALPLQYVILVLSISYYLDRVKVTIKGAELELAKILNMYKIVDFSCNKFRGMIPDAVGGLKALYILNLSHNALTGTIPPSMGNLTQLGSLDLSMNQLTGTIPPKLGDLTFLSVLNLSYNQLIGKIPDGRQFQTFPETSFLGNTGLCGFPLNLSCNNSNSSELSPTSLFDVHTAKNGIEWGYITAAFGFSVGLGIISCLNFFSPKWWQKFNALILQFLFRVLHLQVQERVYRNPVVRL